MRPQEIQSLDAEPQSRREFNIPYTPHGNPVHRAQVLSYLRLMDKQLGLLINVHVERLVVGVDRIVNKFGWPASLRQTSVNVPTDTQ